MNDPKVPDGELVERLFEALHCPVPVVNRDALGRMVREAWLKWAGQQPNPKAHWLHPYDTLSEPDKEVDRQIGEELARFGSQAWTAQNRFLFQDIVAALRAGESNSEALTAERDAALARVKVLEEDSRDRSRQSNGSSGRVV